MRSASIDGERPSLEKVQRKASHLIPSCPHTRCTASNKAGDASKKKKQSEDIELIPALPAAARAGDAHGSHDSERDWQLTRARERFDADEWGAPVIHSPILGLMWIRYYTSAAGARGPSPGAVRLMNYLYACRTMRFVCEYSIRFHEWSCKRKSSLNVLNQIVIKNSLYVHAPNHRGSRSIVECIH